MSIDKKPVILIAEDDENDVFLITRALRKSALDAEFYFVRNGEAAIEYFQGVGKYADRKVYPLPDVAILDLKMPRTTGLEVLKWLRGHEDFRDIPVMIYSASEEEQDIRKANSLGANYYAAKTADENEIGREFKRFVLFCFTSSESPTLSRRG
jgi:CheY-like chemotaxis protein